MVGEGAGADDRVVAPVVAVAPHPGRQAGGDHRAGDAGGELLQPREEGVAIDDQRHALDHAGVRVGLHRGGEPHDRRARNQAVGVEHQHVRIGGAPAGDEIGDVARLARGVLAPAAIVDALARQPLPHRQQRALLGDPEVGVGGVGKEEIVEMVAEPGRAHVFADRLHRGEDARRRLVVDRHDHRGPALELLRQRPEPRRPQEPDEAVDARSEGERDPGEVDDEQHDQRPFERGDLADGDHAVHLARAVGGQRGRAAEHGDPREPGRMDVARRDPASPFATVERPQRLHRHRQRRLARRRRLGVRRGRQAVHR